MKILKQVLSRYKSKKIAPAFAETIFKWRGGDLNSRQPQADMNPASLLRFNFIHALPCPPFKDFSLFRASVLVW